MKDKNQLKIVVTSGKGGVGKSMLASTLAMLFAQEKKVVAIDADVDGPNLAIWLGGIKEWDKIKLVSSSKKPVFDMKKCDGCGLCQKNCKFGAIKMKGNKPYFNPFLCEGCGLCEFICPKKAIKMKPVNNGEIKIKKISFSKQYEFLLVSGALYSGETGSGKIVDQLKSEADKFEADIQIIDSAPGTGCPVNAALSDANFALLVSEPTPSGIADLKRILEVINHFNLSYSIVINKWDINPSLFLKIKKEFKNHLLGKISYNKEIFQAVSQLKPILETNLKTKKEIRDIYTQLKLIVGNQDS